MEGEDYYANWTGMTLMREEQIPWDCFDKELDGVVIWEGNRTEVDAFDLQMVYAM